MAYFFLLEVWRNPSINKKTEDREADSSDEAHDLINVPPGDRHRDRVSQEGRILLHQDAVEDDACGEMVDGHGDNGDDF